MADVVGVLRLILAGVFVVAGWAKLSDRPATRKAIEAFGVPPALAAPGRVLLPLAELAVAVALLVSSWSQAGGLGAALLLGLFILGISVNLARGRRPDCNCFGQVHSEPIGASTLVRNVILGAGAATVAAAGPGNFISSWIDRGTAALWLGLTAGAVIALMAWFIVNLTGMQGRLLDRIERLENALDLPPVVDENAPGLPLGTEAPTFELASVSGETVSLDGLLADGLPLVLVFTSAECAPCRALLPEVAGWEAQHALSMRFAVIASGDHDVNRAKADEAGIAAMLLQEGSEVADDYRYLGTPGAVVVNAAGRIASPITAGADGIRQLVRDTARGRLPSQRWIPVALNGGGHDHQHDEPAFNPGPGIGTPAPEIELADLAGKPVRLSAMRGAPTLVLFWRQTCGFCAGMLDDLRAWDNRPDRDAGPQLLVVSTGTVEEHDNMQLQSPVVIDTTANVMSQYGANGTPMAVLVDADGLVASDLAVGSVGVMELTRSDAALASK